MFDSDGSAVSPQPRSAPPGDGWPAPVFSFHKTPEVTNSFPETLRPIAPPAVARGRETIEVRSQAGSKSPDSDAVAVIVSCHNYGRFLAECLDSILAQTHRPTEIIVVLDACTDESGAIAGRYRGDGVRAVEIRSRDIYLARRAGLQRTTSPLVLFVDADDIFPPNYIADLVPQMDDARIGIATGHAKVFGLTNQDWIPDITQDIQKLNNVTSASLVRRTALMQAGGLSDFSQVGTLSQDWATWQAIVNAGWKIAQANTFYRYRRHGGNATIFIREPERKQPKKVRVLFVTPCLGIGGVERHLHILIRHSHRIEWSATLIQSEGYSDDEAIRDLQEFMPVHGCRQLCPRTGNNSSLVVRHENDEQALEELERHADVVYAWGNVDRLLAKTNLPVVYGIHCSGRWGLEFTAKCAPLATRIVAVSDYVRSFVPEDDHQRSTTVRNGVDVTRLAITKSRQKIRSEWGIPEGRRVIAFVGRWSPEKNPMALAEAAAVLREDYHVVYCTPQSRPGMSSIPPAERSRANTLCGGRITWTYTSQPGNIYHAADAVVLPSFDEAASLTAMEALMGGTPLVATPVGSLPELERNFTDLVSFIPHRPTPQQLADGILQALGPCHISRVPAIQQYMLENFTAQYMVDQWEAEFMRVSSLESKSSS